MTDRSSCQHLRIKAEAVMSHGSSESYISFWHVECDDCGKKGNVDAWKYTQADAVRMFLEQ
jgi:hypothetical protein